MINKIHHADFFDILKQITDESVDLVLTDQPYNITNYEYDKIKN
jgi:DNA modification methylase